MLCLRFSRCTHLPWPDSDSCFVLMSPVFKIGIFALYISLWDISTWYLNLLQECFYYVLIVDQCLAVPLWGKSQYYFMLGVNHDMKIMLWEALLRFVYCAFKRLCPIQCPQVRRELRTGGKLFWNPKTMYIVFIHLPLKEFMLKNCILYYMVHCAWLCMTLSIFVMKENKRSYIHSHQNKPSRTLFPVQIII